MGSASDYLKAHQTCEVCRMRPAVFVSFGARKAYCRKCGEAYIHQGHALIEPFRMDAATSRRGDSMDTKTETVEDALRKLQEHEANAYLGNDRQDTTVNEDESVEDALQHLKDCEAVAYLQEG